MHLSYLYHQFLVSFQIDVHQIWYLLLLLCFDLLDFFQLLCYRATKPIFPIFYRKKSKEIQWNFFTDRTWMLCVCFDYMYMHIVFFIFYIQFSIYNINGVSSLFSLMSVNKIIFISFDFLHVFFSLQKSNVCCCFNF